MIDSMIGNLKKEQDSDTQKKVDCESTFEFDDKRKSLGDCISDSETAIAEMQGTIEELTSQIAQLVAGIKALDKMVPDATEQRKQENADYKEFACQSQCSCVLKSAFVVGFWVGS